MATLTVQDITISGTAVTTAAVSSGGDEFLNTNNNVFTEVWNDHATDPRTLTIETTKTVGGLAVADRDITIPALSRIMIRPLDGSIYNDGDNKAQLTYSDSGADMRIAVFKMA